MKKIVATMESIPNLSFKQLFYSTAFFTIPFLSVKCLLVAINMSEASVNGKLQSGVLASLAVFCGSLLFIPLTAGFLWIFFRFSSLFFSLFYSLYKRMFNKSISSTSFEREADDE